MMARKYLAPTCSYEISDGTIRTDGSVHHKVTGTSMAGILGLSPWSSPFQVACALLGLGREDISGKPAVETGKALEPVVIDYLDRTFPEHGLFLAAEQVFEKREGDHDSWASDFEDDVFAGHVDGIVMRKHGDSAEEFILEIKTSANVESWAEADRDGVPEYYFWQVALYNEFLTRRNMAYVGLGIVDRNTYANPQSWVPSSRTVSLFEMGINREEVREGMQKVREWYAEYILNNTTPPMDPNNPGDVELYSHLENLSSTIEDMEAKLAKLADMDYKVKVAEASYNDIVSARDAMQAQVKEYMQFHDLSTLEAINCTARLTTSVRKSIDKALLEADGIDPSKYTKETVVASLKLKGAK